LNAYIIKNKLIYSCSIPKYLNNFIAADKNKITVNNWKQISARIRSCVKKLKNRITKDNPVGQSARGALCISPKFSALVQVVENEPV
jgi:hypothetical protein